MGTNVEIKTKKKIFLLVADVEDTVFFYAEFEGAPKFYFNVLMTCGHWLV